MTGGDYHGLLAINVKILRRLDSDGKPGDEEFVEVMIEHSKTGHQRWITAVGTSLGPAKVRLADHLRAYWRQAGFVIATRDEAGFRVESPNYCVLRVSVVALSDSPSGDGARIDILESVLRRSTSEEARRWASYSTLRAKQRLDGDSLEKRYINVIGGAADSEQIKTVAFELTRAARLRVEALDRPRPAHEGDTW